MMFRETEVMSLACDWLLTEKGRRLARVSVINFFGNVVLETLVKPWAKVTNYY